MNYEQARAYAVNVSRSGSILGLDSIENLMHELGDIQEQLKIILFAVMEIFQGKKLYRHP